jgi:predicted transposase YbfD/YdcC
MARRIAQTVPAKPQSQSASKPWRERAANKSRKKRIIQGTATTGTGPSKENRSSRKRRKKKEDGSLPIVSSMIRSFSQLADPRVNRRRRHLLIDIIVVAVLAVICNADGWKEMHIWGTSNKQWLQTMLALPNGIPSRDTFRRTISRLDPDQFQEAFLGWLAGITGKVKGVVAIDGKTLRGSRTRDKDPLHIVSAWASEQHLTLGQQTVDGKSNEITAIPKLLATLALQGAIVTIDAMGCQKAIAEQIIDAHADYCLAVKDNDPTLADDIRQAFLDAMANDFADVPHERHEESVPKKAHGRSETRYYYTMPVPEDLRSAAEWKGIKSIGTVISYRDANGDGEVRYYINSFASNAEKFAGAVRRHWGIENSLHWVMDVTFREDESRIHKDHGAENVSWLRRVAISLIKRDTTIKDTIRAKRIRAGYDVAFLRQMLESISEEI